MKKILKGHQGLSFNPQNWRRDFNLASKLDFSFSDLRTPWQDLFRFSTLNPTSSNQEVLLIAGIDDDKLLLQFNSIKASSDLKNNWFNKQLDKYGFGGLQSSQGTGNDVVADMETLFSTGLGTAGNNIINNITKGEALTQGLITNTGNALGGAAVGLGANYIGQGISSLAGHSKLGNFTGLFTATGLANGRNIFNSIKTLLLAKQVGATRLTADALKKASDISKMNLAGIGMSAVGAGLSSAFGPSKEYNGRYGNITRTMDSVYDIISAGAGYVPGVGTAVSGAMMLNKGLSNIFGSTDGMCVCAGTKVFTSTGDIKNIEDLTREDGIIGWDQLSHNILPNTIKGFIDPHLKLCLEIELKNGTVLRCSVDHPILSNIKEKAESHRINGKRIAFREWSFRRADELKIGNWVGLANNIDYWGNEEMPNAYLVGMLIGDGTYTYESSCKLWTADPSTWKYLEDNNLAVLIGLHTPENSNGKYSIENRDYRIINGMELVKNLGIAYLSGTNKTLPKKLGRYNKDSICRMIAGLYDTDGSLSINEEKDSYKITLYQSNLNLLEDIKLLLLKLGIFGTIYRRKSSINKMSNGRTINSNESYRLELSDRNSIINFYKNIPLNIDYKKEHLERIYNFVLPKKELDHNELSGAKQYKIVSIKSIGIQTVYNLEASETHTYLANGIITHNTKTDAILGSAFMLAPVKWLNMAGSKKTGDFYNLSWLNSEKADTFMQNGFGNLSNKFDLAREEANKRYGTFSRGAYKKAQGNIDFANNAWDLVLAMADLNELQNIRSEAMSSINNQRYAQLINGGYNPVFIGKEGMKIFNNATNHNIGMRLLSAAALIDDKQIILCNAQD